MKRGTTPLITSILTAIGISCASQGSDSVGTIADSEPSPAYFLPAIEIIEANLGMGAYNRFVRRVDYARIDPETMWHNIGHDWTWDDNNFEVNQIGHPIQGGMYYSIARANGHGYLGSLAYTTFGSIQWEYFMETEPPAINDLVTTRMGGAMIGETTWRLAEFVSGNATGEPGNWLRSTGAFLINPIYGINRCLRSEPGRRTAPVGSAHHLLGLRISSGRILGKIVSQQKGLALDKNGKTRQVPLGSSNIRIAYGDPFEGKKPFDHFAIGLGASFLSKPAMNVSIRAQLWKFHKLETEATRHSFQLTQNYDYISGSIYKLSSNSFGIEWLAEIKPGEDWQILVRAQPVFVAMGAASTEYYLNIERDYNLGYGAGWKAGLVVRKPGFGSFTASTDRDWIHTQSGAPGDELIDLHSVELLKDIWKGFGIGLSYKAYMRSGYYDSEPDVRIRNQEFGAFGAWAL